MRKEPALNELHFADDSIDHKFYTDRGFVLSPSKTVYMHPLHWRVATPDEQHNVGCSYFNSSVFIPLTREARVFAAYIAENWEFYE